MCVCACVCVCISGNIFSKPSVFLILVFNLLHCVLSTDARDKHTGIKYKLVAQNIGNNL